MGNWRMIKIERLKNSNLNILRSIGFIIGLTVLLLNDFLFKGMYGNWLTGKLSDFAGLFIFPLFWTALFPKYKRTFFVLTAVVFFWWKSPLSSTFILFCNDILNYPINRIVDYSDLIALLILPVAYFYYNSTKKTYVNLSPMMIGLIAFFAFAATSAHRPQLHFHDSPALPVVAWEKSVDTFLLSEERIQELRTRHLDTNGLFRTFDIWGGRINGGTVAEFDSIILLRVEAIPLFEDPKRMDDFERIPYKTNLSEFALPALRNISDSNESFFLKKLDTLSITTHCFGSKESFSFKESRLHGPYRQYHPNDSVWVSGNYVHGVEDGVWSVYFSNGRLEKEIYYNNGQRTKQIRYNNDEVYQKEKFSSRKGFVRNNLIGLGVLVFLGLVLLIKLFFPGSQDRYKTHVGATFLISLTPPILAKILQVMVPLFHTWDFFDIFPHLLQQAVVSILTFQLYNLRPRSTREIIWLVTFLTLIIIIYEQWFFIKDFL
ncbi:MAG: hypothetical protein DWQ02_04245 [Bacteroidetes bacterium]|nr:MAG: hypothetical protein DWQ02_04245 [Bacteroidota bacterium]